MTTATATHAYTPAKAKWGGYRAGCRCGWVSDNEWAGPRRLEVEWAEHVKGASR